MLSWFITHTLSSSFCLEMQCAPKSETSNIESPLFKWYKHQKALDSVYGKCDSFNGTAISFLLLIRWKHIVRAKYLLSFFWMLVPWSELSFWNDGTRCVLLLTTVNRKGSKNVFSLRGAKFALCCFTISSRGNSGQYYIKFGLTLKYSYKFGIKHSGRLVETFKLRIDAI